jgi:hypothetical protein
VYTYAFCFVVLSPRLLMIISFGRLAGYPLQVLVARGAPLWAFHFYPCR